jgi:low temperature requirement protein LtrA
VQYHVAWALILINIGAQYMIELRNHRADVWNRDIIKRMATTLFVGSAIVLAAAFVSPQIAPFLSLAAIFSGIILTALSRNISPAGAVDFMHLTERAMLYVVFTFGEMIIVVSAYFIGKGNFDSSVIYFSLMAFLIVAGLFVSYEIFYDHLLDREMENDGMLYMMIHIFLIFALGCITVSLEFMREEEVSLRPKVIFITVSIIGYFVFMICTGLYAKKKCRLTPAFLLRQAAAAAAFVILMMIFMENMKVNIFVTVVYVWSAVAEMLRAKRMIGKETGGGSASPKA